MKLQNKIPKAFEIRIGKHLYISLWIIPVLIFAFRCGYIKLFVLTYLCALLHELAHILCAKMLSVSVSTLSVYPFGISAKLSAGYIRKSEKEFLIAFCGPLFSIVLFWICTALHRIYGSELLLRLSVTNLALCIVNLIPALPLDGGRMFKSILTARFGIIRAYNLTLKASRIAVIVLFITAASVLFLSGFNFSLILVSAFLLQNLCSEQQAITLITVKELMQNHKKAAEAELLPSKVLCINKNRPATIILKHLSYDCFYVVCATDNDFRIAEILTETQIIDALTKNGVRTKLADIQPQEHRDKNTPT